MRLDASGNNNGEVRESAVVSAVTRWCIYFSSQQFDWVFLAVLLAFEAALCQLIIKNIGYTEIDWKAYMQEVEGWWIDGETNYYNLRGDTGPLVYPAGFLYLFTWFRSVTDGGNNIQKGQQIFAALYVIQLLFLLSIYKTVFRALYRDPTATKVWSYRIAMGCLCLSKRLHSIFVLRLFNDGCAMLFFYWSLRIFMGNNWKVGCAFFSLAVSIKMNVLLFAPGLLLLLLQSQSKPIYSVLCLAICATVQLVLGAPFLTTYPIAYLRKAFELDRVFFYKWTVNWKFLDEELFVSKSLSIVLLLGHISTLVYLLVYKWRPKLFLGSALHPAYIAYTLLMSNFVGIVFARTLHYQFYSWYFHAIPLMMWLTGRSWYIKALVLLTVEYSFNVFPATPLSSAFLQVAHLVLLWSIRSPQELGIPILREGEKEA